MGNDQTNDRSSSTSKPEPAEKKGSAVTNGKVKKSGVAKRKRTVRK